MEWYVLVLMLILPSLSRADCSAQCLKCAEQISDLNSPGNRMTCTLECEGTLSSSIARCEKALQALSDDLEDLSEKDLSEDFTAEDTQAPSSDIVKRYGGFIKRIDRNKNKILISPWKENTIQKGLFATKYGDALLKLVERNVPELSEDEDEGEDVTSENEMGVYDNDLPLNEVKRYGGFLRKFGPKRSDFIDESTQQELQKRYGGFMRRIRPKLKWDNQKRYGGFLRRHFKISVRSDEEPSLLHD
ncbi:proenkephalin-B [Brachyhypopomus gauderio]|uniref:proenkephalin-B n=1 Tax=Brachyhypopomus gauderio TaxID=698409 RepID=UPI004042C1D3